jgi:hypothetical protein
VADEHDVQRIALSFPEAMESGSAYNIRDKGFAWYYREKLPGQSGRVERRDVLAIRVLNEDEKQMLLAADPEKFFTTPHYNGFPAILVRLPAIEIDELTELLTDAWRLRAPKKMVREFDAKAAV